MRTLPVSRVVIEPFFQQLLADRRARGLAPQVELRGLAAPCRSFADAVLEGWAKQSAWIDQKIFIPANDNTDPKVVALFPNKVHKTSPL